MGGGVCVYISLIKKLGAIGGYVGSCLSELVDHSVLFYHLVT
jgi:hypothetical protein